ncbi:hypothetical protein ACG02S_24075 [Roseateles sp. DC23W]|uniref:Uncharacterized protein n=1 Tax=Pelomonas dachongensis TaxID=3299029 RepID=A0ABW7EU52_9BURK
MLLVKTPANTSQIALRPIRTPYPLRQSSLVDHALCLTTKQNMKLNHPRQHGERRTEEARREAFDQRDRSKRMNLGLQQQKASEKLSTSNGPALRMI